MTTHRFGCRGAALLLTLAWLLLGAAAGHARGQDRGTFTLTCLEIPDLTIYNHGAGLAVVLQTPGGKTYLYDTGVGYPGKNGQAWSHDYNAGRDTVLPFLQSKGIDRIDGIMISHAHYDHFGGLMWLADHQTIPKLIDSGFTFQGKPGSLSGELAAYEKIRERFKKMPGAYVEGHTGDRLKLDDQLDVEVVSPPKAFYPANPKFASNKRDSPEHFLVNTNSLGVRITHGSVSFLLPGDVQNIDQEDMLVANIPAEKLHCQILVAPAHGIGASPAFAKATHPEVTIASAPGRYATGSTTPKVYSAVGSKVFLTGIHGNVKVTSNGHSYTVEAAFPNGKPKDAGKTPEKGSQK